MTITSTTSRNDHIGTGTTGPFPYGFRILKDTDLRVTKRAAATGVEITLSLSTHYTVTGVGKAAGGSITLISALASGDTLTIRRVRPLKRTTDIRNQGAYYPEIHEDALDQQVMLDQQQQDALDRSRDPRIAPRVRSRSR